MQLPRMLRFRRHGPVCVAVHFSLTFAMLREGSHDQGCLRKIAQACTMSSFHLCVCVQFNLSCASRNWECMCHILAVIDAPVGAVGIYNEFN